MKNLASVVVLALVVSLLNLTAVANTPQAKKAQATNTRKQRQEKSATKKERHPAFDEVIDNPKLPRVLLIGDSISIGYTVPVRKLLAEKANVHRIPTNGGDTVRGLELIEKWLGKKRWDVIHFNWGLHDLKRLKGGKYDATGTQVRSPKEYATNLEKLVVRLKKTGATLIWASTTPVPKSARGRLHGDSVIFNGEAAKIMKKHGIRVNDLYGYVMPTLAKAQKPRNVHFTQTGQQMLGKKVAKEITAALEQREAVDVGKN